MNFFTQFKERPQALILTGDVQHYAWGGKRYIPELLQRQNGKNLPWAELWLGAHPNCPSTVEMESQHTGLDNLIKKFPELTLGKEVIHTFGNTLPYLFKILDASDMLSIQAHPSKKQAEEGYKRENKLKIPLTAPYRNYKDANHKPEVHVALTDFWMLHGFKDLAKITSTLQSIPEFKLLADIFSDKDLKKLYKYIMEMPQTDIDHILDPILTRLFPQLEKGNLYMDNQDYWAALASANFPLPDGHRDRGIISIYLMNLLHLAPGEGTFQPAGVPHAYLHGTTVELMANSDNVLRGGLTPKHIDVNEILNTLDFDAGSPQILTGEQISATERVYKTPALDFELSKISITPDTPYISAAKHGPDILLVLEGGAGINCGSASFARSGGEAFFVPADMPYLVKTNSFAVLFKATVPLKKE